jgi:prepilin-type N-terminal cleavage/methylation domain-containing protein
MRRKSHGYTLPEVLMSLVVLLVALLALTGIITTGVTAHSRHEAIRTAVGAASTEMEELRRLSFQELDGRDGHTFAIPGLERDVGDVGTIDVSATGVSTLRKVTITVEWDRPHGGDFELETVFTE